MDLGVPFGGVVGVFFAAGIVGLYVISDLSEEGNEELPAIGSIVQAIQLVTVDIGQMKRLSVVTFYEGGVDEYPCRFTA